MHGTIHAIGPSLSNAYTFRGVSRTDEERRVRDVRERVPGISTEIEVAAETDSDWLVGPRYESMARRGSQGSARPARAQREGDGEEAGEFIEAISVWA